MEWKDSGKRFTELWGKYRAVLLILAAGILLLTWPVDRKEQQESPEAGTVQVGEETLAETEARMKKLLKRIDGVGQLELMLTLESSSRRKLATDTEISYKGNAVTPEDYSKRSETVIVSCGQDDSPVVAYTESPAYRGAVVVCQGAENPGVRLAVTQAVAALTGLGSDRIMVIKCQS